MSSQHNPVKQLFHLPPKWDLKKSLYSHYIQQAIFKLCYLVGLFSLLISISGRDDKASNEEHNQHIQDLIQSLNKEHAERGGTGSFYTKKNEEGYLDPLFSESTAPQWAIDVMLDALEIKQGFGSGGINPFRLYTKIGFDTTELSKYFRLHALKLEMERKDNKASGLEILMSAKKKFGRNIFEKMNGIDLHDELMRKGMVYFFIFLFAGLPLFIWSVLDYRKRRKSNRLPKTIKGRIGYGIFTFIIVSLAFAPMRRSSFYLSF